MKIPLHIAEKLLQLSQGAVIAAGVAKHLLIETLILENIIERNGRIQKRLHLKDTQAFHLYLQNKYSISDLKKYIEILKKEQVLRKDLVEISTDSKLKAVRTFKGFLINGYDTINVKINNKPTTFQFTDGVFQFIYDFENFVPAKNITIVGIENPENFRFIENQKYLFKDILPLFVCRYPQHQSKDFIKWLLSIPNKYLHFGDFDFAGIGIYLNEFKKHINDRASFLIPYHIEKLLEKNGNRDRYNNQKINFEIENIKEEKLLALIKTIKKLKKGLDQEIFIN